METKIKIDANEIVFDIVMGIIPLVCLIIVFKTITMSLIGTYFLIAFFLYYCPKLVSYGVPVIEFDNEVIHFKFLFWNKEIVMEDIRGYSINEDFQKTIFCKSKQNITLYLRNSDKKMRFSAKSQNKLIEVLNQREISVLQNNEIHYEENKRANSFIYIVFFIAIIVSNCFFFIFKNQLIKKEQNQMIVLFGINFFYVLIYLIGVVVNRKNGHKKYLRYQKSK